MRVRHDSEMVTHAVSSAARQNPHQRPLEGRSVRPGAVRFCCSGGGGHGGVVCLIFGLFGSIFYSLSILDPPDARFSSQVIDILMFFLSRPPSIFWQLFLETGNH
jgi:hypothetical protein